MKTQVLLASVLAMVCAACTTETAVNEADLDAFWQASEQCNGVELCTYATLFTSEYKRMSREPVSSGVSVRRAQTDGKTVSIEYAVPEQIKSEPIPSGQTPDEFITANLQSRACSVRIGKRFFSVGGTMVVTLVLPSGERFSRSTIDAC